MPCVLWVDGWVGGWGYNQADSSTSTISQWLAMRKHGSKGAEGQKERGLPFLMEEREEVQCGLTAWCGRAG